MAFETKGDVAQWRMVYDTVRELPVEAVITIEELEDIYPNARRQRGPVQRAIKELEDVDRRTLAPLRGKGYRVARAAEHADLAKRKHSSARRTLRKAVSKARSANRAELTPDERERIDRLELNLAAQEAMLGRVDRRVTRVEKQAAVTDSRVDVILATLAAHGIQINASAKDRAS